MATHSSILAWKIPWTEEPGRLQSMGLQKVSQDWAIEHSRWQLSAFKLYIYSFVHWLKSLLEWKLLRHKQGLFCTSLCSQHAEQCLIHSKSLINRSWINTSHFQYCVSSTPNHVFPNDSTLHFPCTLCYLVSVKHLPWLLAQGMSTLRYLMCHRYLWNLPCFNPPLLYSPKSSAQNSSVPR